VKYLIVLLFLSLSAHGDLASECQHLVAKKGADSADQTAACANVTNNLNLNCLSLVAFGADSAAAQLASADQINACVKIDNSFALRCVIVLGPHPVTDQIQACAGIKTADEVECVGASAVNDITAADFLPASQIESCGVAIP
jgi:hypothetical protein